jgi:NADH-quinone oxidoreductase subunit G
MAADPLRDDAELADAVRGTGFLVVQELFLTATARAADVVFPAQAFTEREGSVTSGDRRVQRFYPAVPTRHAHRIRPELAPRSLALGG